MVNIKETELLQKKLMLSKSQCLSEIVVDKKSVPGYLFIQGPYLIRFNQIDWESGRLARSSLTAQMILNPFEFRDGILRT